MCPVTLPASWVASTKRCKDAGSVHSSSMDATEDAAARRVIAGQGGRTLPGASLTKGSRAVRVSRQPPRLARSQRALSSHQEVTDGSWLDSRYTRLRPPARAFDWAAGGAVPVDHAHGAGGGRRLLDLHLGPARGRVAAARRVHRACRLSARGELDRSAREGAAVGGRA